MKNEHHHLLENRELLFEEFPELRGLELVEQNPEFHPEGDVLTHTLMVAGHVVHNPVLFVAALLHDVGKRETFDNSTGKITSHGHDKVSAEVAASVVERLDLNEEEANTVVFLVRHHMKPHHGSVTLRTVRRLLNESDEATLRLLVELAHADVSSGSKNFDQLERFKELLEVALTTAVPVKADSLLNGNEVMEVLGLQPGPAVGKAMALVAASGATTKEEAIEFLKGIVNA